MIRVPFHDGWAVGPKLGAFEASAATPPQPVTVPHDAVRNLPRSVDSGGGVNTGYHPGGVFEYTKTFDVPEQWRDKSVMIEFEGVYRDAVVFVNGEFAAHEPQGYAAFVVAADAFLRFGEINTISVEARAHQDSRWYSGAGIYRPVHLIVAEPVHIELGGVRVTTPDIEAERAIVEIATTARNETRHTRTTRVSWSITRPDGMTVAGASAPLTLLPGVSATARVRLAVTDPDLWGPESPALYEVHSSLTEEPEGPGAPVLDEDRTRFGIRRLQVDAERGLRINGRPVNLRGACVHHDNGPLGAATVDGAEDRRIRLLKRAGFNAIRSAHNPASRAMLDACDRHGVLVMDELSDVWTRSKTAFDASIVFPERWQQDVAAMVAKDFNHPSVIMYSIGNEILELATPIGATWSRRIAEAVRALDDTRFVTNGINGVIANLAAMTQEVAALEAADPNTMMANMGEKMSLVNASELVTRSTEESASVLDVVGYNYADSRYALEAELFPHRVLVGSETFPDKIDVMWGLVTAMSHVIGDFTWTGWDYLGEAGIGRVDYSDVEGYQNTGTAGPYPYLLAETGDIDITGYRRTISYYREIVFGLRSDPYIAVHRPQHHGRRTATTPWSWDDTVASWSWSAPAGSPVTVDVYADADEVELLLDGKSLGVSEIERYRARFEVKFAPGELLAVARRRGVEVGRHVLRSAAAAVSALRLAASVDGSTLDDYAFVAITLEDAAGIVPCDADVLVTVVVEGGELAGLGTGRARTEESFAGPCVTTYDGRALAVVRGPGLVTVTADGFEPLRIRLE